jgi:hypothetical protein
MGSVVGLVPATHTGEETMPSEIQIESSITRNGVEIPIDVDAVVYAERDGSVYVEDLCAHDFAGNGVDLLPGEVLWLTQHIADLSVENAAADEIDAAMDGDR